MSVEEQPAPVPNKLPAVWDLVLEDMNGRDRVGEVRYGTRLQPHNSRDALMDAYAEALDLVVYLRQAIYERDNPPSKDQCQIRGCRRSRAPYSHVCEQCKAMVSAGKLTI